MSADDKLRVKAAVERFVADPANTRVAPGDLAALVKAEIGISFGATTIALYLAGFGWHRRPRPQGPGIHYVRPGKGGARRSADAPPSNSEAPLPDGVSEQAARSKRDPRGTIPTGTGGFDMKTHIPLDKLFLSPRNVRKSNGEVDIPELADLIHSKGLLQNLVVSVRDAARGTYEVVAGGRRWRALKLLVKQGRLARDWPSPAHEIPAEDATAASLAENIRVPLNPADEVVAYGAVIESYADVEPTLAAQIARCARRFGKEVRYIEERLRLAYLAPDILEALRLDQISLDAAKAYAAYPDQELQQKVFVGQEAMRMRGANKHSVSAIKAALAGKIYRRGDRQVRYVTVDAYLAAGGRVELELFMGHADEEVLLDTALVDRLARAKAEPEARRLAEEAGYFAGGLWAWGPHGGWPKTPAGYDQSYQGLDRLTDEEKPTAIAIYWIAEDGSRLELSPHCFRKRREPKEQRLAGLQPESEIDRLSRIRREKIEERAIHLATPVSAFAGTALEERVFWPPDDVYHVEKVQRDADGNYAVALLIFVPKEDVEAVMANAERLFDEDEAAAIAAKAQAAAGDQSPAPAEARVGEAVS
ncbi:MAG: ParB family transcriptional regulator, chromosome partitioning protein [Sphingomonadales bacterium]|jgi:ParB family chromosome partitioning protein|nr:ParB family transcriptional regulator, chromosome partitioning protein [Sphingomonadales bacterium]